MEPRRPGIETVNNLPGMWKNGPLGRRSGVRRAGSEAEAPAAVEETRGEWRAAVMAYSVLPSEDEG